MTVVPLVRAGGWVGRNEVALARAYGATKAVYAVCRMVQDGEAVDPVTARAFRRRAERTGAGLLSLGGEGSSVVTQYWPVTRVPEPSRARSSRSLYWRRPLATSGECTTCSSR